MLVARNSLRHWMLKLNSNEVFYFGRSLLFKEFSVTCPVVVAQIVAATTTGWETSVVTAVGWMHLILVLKEYNNHPK